MESFSPYRRSVNRLMLPHRGIHDNSIPKAAFVTFPLEFGPLSCGQNRNGQTEIADRPWLACFPQAIDVLQSHLDIKEPVRLTGFTLEMTFGFHRVRKHSSGYRSMHLSWNRALRILIACFG